MLDTVLKNPWVRALGALLILLLIAGVFYLLLPILTALLFSFIVAYILTPVVNFGEKMRIPRMVTISVLLILLMTIMTTLPLYLVTNVIYEANALIQRASGNITEERLDLLLDELPLRELVIYLGWAPEDAAEFNERAVIIEQIGTIIQENALQFVRNYGRHMADMSAQAGRSAAQIVTSLGGWTLSTISFLINISLFALVSVYLLRDYDAFISGMRELVPPRYRAHLDDVMHKIDLQLRSLLRGQVTVCVSLALMYGIGLHWAQAPFALPIALFGGAASIIPYIGPLLTLTPAVFLTLLFYGIGSNLFWVFAVFVTVQIIETYFLTPRVLGSRIGLNPVWVVVAFIVFSSAFGFLGVVIAVPTAAILKVLILEAGAYYRRSDFYREPSAASPGSSDSSSASSSGSSVSSGTSGSNPA